jgi:predicted PurR-regulated permease PerM
MRLRTVLTILFIALLAVFTAANWGVFVAPTRLSVLVTSFEAPLGFLMLVILMAVVLAFVAYMAVWQGQALAESRRNAKELERQRLLADQAETSRFSDLRALMQSESQRVSARIGEVQEALRNEIRENTNSLAATIGEMDDRLRRAGETEQAATLVGVTRKAPG